MKWVWLASVLATVVLVAIPGTAMASTYTNPNPVTIPEGPSETSDGLASPYPSNIAVTDLPGAVTHARATLNSFSHSFPEDLELALVAPDGKYTVLMDQVCGAEPDIDNQTFVFDDTGGPLPNEGPCVSGTFRPTIASLSGSTTMPPPAPQGTLTNAAMSALNGSPASGSWSLFIFDQECCDDPPPPNLLAGGWTLDLLTDATCYLAKGTLTGTAEDETLTGTEGNDVILGFGGRDTINGLGGKDTICGGALKDTLSGGPGKDKLNGGGGKDVCKGGKADDTAKKCEVEKSI